jgi:hypothetical protein
MVMRRSVWRLSVPFAAVLTVLVAVAMDVVAGEPLAHVATLGVISIVVGVVRMSLAGNYCGYFSLLSGAIVAQPALHAAMKLFPTGGDQLTFASSATVHAIFTAIVVAAVIGAQVFIQLVGRVNSFIRSLLSALQFTAGRQRFARYLGYTGLTTLERMAVTMVGSPRGPPVRVLA